MLLRRTMAKKQRNSSVILLGLAVYDRLRVVKIPRGCKSSLWATLTGATPQKGHDMENYIFLQINVSFDGSLICCFVLYHILHKMQEWILR
jgi:hypothetical protein